MSNYKATTNDELRIYLMGEVKIVLNGEEIHLNPQQEATLVYLILKHDEIKTNKKTKTREKIVNWLFAESETGNRRNDLKRLIHTIKSDLGKQWFVGKDTDVLNITHPDLFIDVIRFWALTDDVLQENSSDDHLIEKSIEAIGLYQGEIRLRWDLPDEDFLRYINLDSHTRQAKIFEILVNNFQNKNDYEHAIQYGEQWYRFDELEEKSYNTLLKLYFVTGNRRKANTFFQAIRDYLANEGFGEPGPETVQIYESGLKNKNFQEVSPGVRLLPLSEPQAPPEMEGFIGREGALEQVSTQLHKMHLTLITGMPGVGKTMFAARVARRVANPRKIFWYTFHEGEEINALLFELAKFLACHGKPEVWEVIRPGSQKTTIPVKSLMDSLLTQIAEQDFLLCLDDFHNIENTPLFREFFQRVIGKLKEGSLKLLAISREKSSLFSKSFIYELEGFTVDELRRLLESRDPMNMENPATFIQELHKATGGNVQILMLVMYVLSEISTPENLPEQLAQVDDIADYLIREVDQRLSEDARRVLEGVAILRGYPATQTIIEAIWDEANVFSALIELQKRGLVVSQRGGNKTYSTTALLRAFYYNAMGLREKREAHHRAGQHYRDEANEAYLAAYHFENGGDFKQATLLATEDVESILNQGHARDLQQLLERLARRKIFPTDSARIYLALGYLRSRKGEVDQALEYLQRALDLLATQEETRENRALRAMAFYRLAEGIQRKDHRAAYEWVEKGLEITGVELALLAGRLLLFKGELLTLYMDKHDRALEAIEQAKALLTEDETALQIRALINLSVIAGKTGKPREAVAYAKEALEMSEKAHDVFATISILNNLSVDMFNLGQLEEAIAYNRQALAQVESLGSVPQQVDLGNNLGWMLTQKGDYPQAEQALTNALTLAKKQPLLEPQIYIHTNLGDLYLRMENWDAAQAHLTGAEKLSTEQNISTQLPEITRNLALLFLHKGETQDARDYIKQSLRLAREAGDTEQEELSLQVLAKIQSASSE